MQVPDIATPRRVVFGSPARSSGRDYSFEVDRADLWRQARRRREEGGWKGVIVATKKIVESYKVGIIAEFYGEGVA